MKIWTMTMLAPVAAMVAHAEMPQADAAQKVEQFVARMQSEGVLNTRSNEWDDTTKKVSREMLAHLEKLKSGEEGLSDYPWLVKMMLLYAAKYEDDVRVPTELVQEMLALGVDVNATENEEGLTALFLVDGSVPVCKTLLAAGAEVNARSKNQATPLHAALSPSDEDVFDLLVEAGADINAADEDGDTPLHNAFCCASKKSRSKLIAAGADVNARNKKGKTPLDIAIAENELEAALELIHAGAAPDAEKYPPLFLACFMGQADEVKRLIDEGNVDLNAEVQGGATLLMLAVNREDKAMVEMLIAAGADVNAKGKDQGNTALHKAVKKGNIEICKLLLAAGADVNAVNKFDFTPMSYASDKGDMEVIEVLIAAGAKMNLTKQMEDAVKNGNADYLRKLIAMGGDVNAKNKDYDESLIAIAAGKGDEEIVDILLEAGADLNQKVDSYRDIPLVQAIRKGNLNMCRKLIEAGADVNPKLREDVVLRVWRDDTGSPLFTALMKNDPDIIALLKEKGAKLTESYDELLTVFENAAVKNNTALCRTLVAEGFKPRFYTPLQLAIMLGQVDEVQRLLAEGADANASKRWINKPLMMAANVGNGKMVDMLLAAGAAVNARNKNGSTPLMFAALRGNAAICRKLLAAGADVNAVNNKKYPAICMAVVSEDVETCRVLMEAGANVKKNVEGSFFRSQSLLHIAASTRKNTDELCILLLDAGLDPNATSSIDKTPLLIYLEGDTDRDLNTPAARRFIECGANIELKNDEGETIKEYAEKERDSSFHFLPIDSDCGL